MAASAARRAAGLKRRSNCPHPSTGNPFQAHRVLAQWPCDGHLALVPLTPGSQLFVNNSISLPQPLPPAPPVKELINVTVLVTCLLSREGSPLMEIQQRIARRVGNKMINGVSLVLS